MKNYRLFLSLVFCFSFSLTFIANESNYKMSQTKLTDYINQIETNNAWDNATELITKQIATKSDCYKSPIFSEFILKTMGELWKNDKKEKFFNFLRKIYSSNKKLWYLDKIIIEEINLIYEKLPQTAFIRIQALEKIKPREEWQQNLIDINIFLESHLEKDFSQILKKANSFLLNNERNKSAEELKKAYQRIINKTVPSLLTSPQREVTADLLLQQACENFILSENLDLAIQLINQRFSILCMLNPEPQAEIQLRYLKIVALREKKLYTEALKELEILSHKAPERIQEYNIEKANILSLDGMHTKSIGMLKNVLGENISSKIRIRAILSLAKVMIKHDQVDEIPDLLNITDSMNVMESSERLYILSQYYRLKSKFAEEFENLTKSLEKIIEIPTIWKKTATARIFTVSVELAKTHKQAFYTRCRKYINLAENYPDQTYVDLARLHFVDNPTSRLESEIETRLKQIEDSDANKAEILYMLMKNSLVSDNDEWMEFLGAIQSPIFTGTVWQPLSWLQAAAHTSRKNKEESRHYLDMALNAIELFKGHSLYDALHNKVTQILDIINSN